MNMKIAEVLAQPKTYWHVTPHTRIRSIMQQGLNFGHKRIWSNTLGGTLGQKRKVYLFSNFDSAIGMAARLEWGLMSENRKNTQVDIVEIQTDVPVEADPNLESQIDRGNWWMTDQEIPPSQIVRVIPLTLQMKRDFIARRDGRA